jgi:hypothetical protein
MLLIVYNTILKSKDTEYVLRLSYIELYNEELRDLLLLSYTSPTPLKIIEDPAIGPLIQGAIEMAFTSPTEMKKLLEEGERHRHFGITNMNAHSSRSHVLVRLYIESRKLYGATTSTPLRQSWDGDRPTCVCTFNLVDLAGSERANKTGQYHSNLKEGSYINKSLLTLGNVINLLSEGNRGQHVPYRNSKLTRLLSSALGGNAKTLIITCISPASGNILESLSSLRFSSRAKRIVNQVYQPLTMDAKTLQFKLAAQQSELDELRALHHNQLQNLEKSLKENVLLALKSQKQLKFILKHAPVVVKELKKLALYEHAYQIKDDVKAVIAGILDINTALEFLDSVVYAYLTKNSSLIHSFETFHDEVNQFSESFPIDSFGQIMSALDNYGDPTLVSLEEVYDGMNFESEELTEEIESHAMLIEEMRQVSGESLILLQQELNKMREIEGNMRSSHKKLVNNEERLIMVINEQENQLYMVRDEYSKLQAKYNTTQLGYESKLQELNEHQNQLSEKDEEIDRLNSRLYGVELEVSALQQSLADQEAIYAKEKTKMREDMDEMLASNENAIKSSVEALTKEKLQMRASQIQLENDIAILQESKNNLLLEKLALGKSKSHAPGVKASP